MLDMNGTAFGPAAQWSFLPKLAQKLNKLICPEHVVAYINWLVG